VIVGDGETRSTLVATAARLGLTDRIHFLGWRADLDVIYADLDVVLLTSRNEGSPVALTEAMAAARPVVATDVGGVRELVGEDGLLCPVDDDEKLAEAVLRVLSSPAWAADVGRRARLRVLSAYSEDRLVADMVTLYERLLPRPPDA
jgi:glycosyltransferase involved in cell wall biosynthesis